jgi:hypothetical protein
MDTNLVWPLTSDTCAVIFDYYLDTSVVRRDQLDSFVEQSLRGILPLFLPWYHMLSALTINIMTDSVALIHIASAGVQEEDRQLCESVQVGLRSTAYRAGRYAPQVCSIHQSQSIHICMHMYDMMNGE